uniref:Uncharacterized protein AlNc14C137G7127 n=1 Tax=Albugo laibachii Nc14 TaxID=890382 RepID=F0WKT8_9STRA|nr:conserved hypothetical protein [Albugo laibachii Nc14]|eukprot:CCA21895.1 conserved hypothetical protein [Albugo laibachii Nc14]
MRNISELPRRDSSPNLQLKRSKLRSKSQQPPPSYSRLSETKESESLVPVGVFLGGSCNPTKWRKDICIPLLQAASISYYDPQVDEWYEELIQVEERAKGEAQMLFIVIDNVTRSIVSLHEAIESIFVGRTIVLVVQFLNFGIKVEGEMLSEEEVDDHNGARRRLQALAHRMEIPLYDDVHDAVQYRLRRRSSITLHKWSSRVMRLAGDQRTRSKSLSCAQFPGKWSLNRLETSQVIQQFAQCRYQSQESVYLGGVLIGTTWRQIVPLLEDAGIPFFIRYEDYLSHQLQQKESQFQWKPLRSSPSMQLVLFVISGNSRSIAAMAEAVELIYSDNALILVMECLREREKLEGGSILCGREFKDLVRARAYLREMAVRQGIHIFGSVREAVESIVRCREA